MVKNIEDNFLLEEGQEGGRTARSTRRQIQKLIWSIQNAEDTGEKLTVAYVDWADAYGSVDHEALFKILQGYCFTEADLHLLRSFYSGACHGSPFTPTGGRRQKWRWEGASAKVILSVQCVSCRL
eukprot:3936295-Rhodomonas_salina.1